MTHRIATIISHIFNPFFVLIPIFIILTYQSPHGMLAFICMALVPLVFYFGAWKTKYISDLFITDRRERPKMLWPLVVLEASGILIFQLWNGLPILAAIIGFAIITHFWKISGHAMAAALVTGTIVATYGWSYWPVLLIVPVVAWARVVRRDHTLAQVVAGALYSWTVLFVLNNYFV